MMSKTIVFVYGTLKRGFYNHKTLASPALGSSKLVSAQATTKDSFPLLIISRYNIPFLLDQESESARPILGELYEVDEDMVKLSSLCARYLPLCSLNLTILNTSLARCIG